MDDRKGLGLLDSLPLSVIENVLALLPIRDVVRTSVLSTKWRYAWRSLRRLVFCNDCVTFSPNEGILEERLNNFINHVLLLQLGPVHKFEIRSSVIGRCRDIDVWLFFLARKDLLVLTIDFEKCSSFRFPSSLFYCKYLSFLQLCCGELDLPLTFEGFSYLKTLFLVDVLVKSEGLKNLISDCPLLERLALSYNHDSDLRICAPNLKYLFIEGKFKEICLQETPQLEVMSIVLYTDRIEEHFDPSVDCNFTKIFRGVPNLRKLNGGVNLTKYLRIGIRQWKPLLQWNHLKIVGLDQINFDDFNEILVVLCLITNSPNLQELLISSWSDTDPIPEDGLLWETECPSNCTFKQLKTVSVTHLNGARFEMEFIGFLLGNSPVLEKMNISSYSNDSLELNMYLLEQLIRFPRASPLAQILFD